MILRELRLRDTVNIIAWYQETTVFWTFMRVNLGKYAPKLERMKLSYFPCCQRTITLQGLPHLQDGHRLYQVWYLFFVLNFFFLCSVTKWVEILVKICSTKVKLEALRDSSVESFILKTSMIYLRHFFFLYRYIVSLYDSLYACLNS